MTETVDDSAAPNEPSAAGSGLIWLWLTAVIIAADQVTKWLVYTRIEIADRIVVNPLLELTHRHNTGAAFSFLASESGWQRWLFVGLGAVVSVFIVGYLHALPRRGTTPLAIGLALILGGAVGNVIDRLNYGFVVDFILIGYRDLVFPYAFNIADAAISVGAALLIIDALFLESRRR
ncbi:MAG: signal peptidase II [Pseudomonadota bacterium]